MTQLPAFEDQTFIKGGGEMGGLIRSHDWTGSSLGPTSAWPQSLLTTLNIIVNARFPMFLWWGPELICFYNDAYRPSLGKEGKHPTILGMPAVEAWSEIWDYIKPLIDQIMAGGDAVYNEDLFLPIFRNGKLEDVYWTFSYSPVTDEQGRINGVLVTCHETTSQVNMLRTLQLSDRRFQTLIRDATVGIIVLSGTDLKVEVVNEAYGRLIERVAEEIRGKPLFDIIPEAEAEFRPIIENVRTTAKTTYLYEHPYTVYKDGKKISGNLNLVYQPYAEVDGPSTGVMIICHDVTEQIRARKEIETALEQLRLSKEAAQLGMFDMDLEKGTMIWDKRCRTLFGISHDNTVSYDRDFVFGLHPDDRDRITRIIDDLFIKAISNGDYDVEYRTIGVEDKRLRWVRAKGKVYFNKQDKPVRFIGSVLDITTEKINEARKNDFIAMVSHELKTPLTSIMAYLQILTRNAAEKNDSDGELLDRANFQAKKMIGLINGFLNVSRFELGRIDLVLSEFSLNDLIKRAIDDQFALPSNINIIFIPCEPISITADRDKIGSVVTNLLSNAVKYSPSGKKITVACTQTENDVVISVRDNGMGIAKDDLPNIFERFYRIENEKTKDISGFGIGLYLSAEIIKFHGGNIWAESEWGAGSTFYFSLPKARPKQ